VIVLRVMVWYRPDMGDSLGTMLTMTTYGTWMRGDMRGWIDSGRLMPPDPAVERADQQRMSHSMFLFDDERLLEIGEAIGQSLQSRMAAIIYAMTVQSQHVHVVLGDTPASLSGIVKCVKDAARWHLRAGRPIWGQGYDKRFCYDETSLRARIKYVERHNVRMGLPRRPWEFITPPFQRD
jgi:hypothetical protein